MTFSTSRQQAWQDTGLTGDSPGYDEDAAVNGNSDGEGEDEDEPIRQGGALFKKMRTASAAAQFWTTIAVKSCLYAKERMGPINSTKRAITIFKKLEIGLRDRSIYPLPADVSSAALLSHSFFKGSHADAEFKKYCENIDTPLSKAMIKIGENVYTNTFGRIRTHISTVVLPKFLDIVESLTGKDGKKSGCATFLFLFSFCFANVFRYNASVMETLQKANRMLHEVIHVL